jgi:hypothetical protein
LPDTATFTDLRTILAPLAEHACIAQAISRMDRLRQVGGQNGFSAARVIEFVRDAVRNQSRLGFSRRADLAMTIQRAKNREFPNIIVVWPHSATGSPEHLRRLLYNAITRAQNHCSVIVLDQGTTERPAVRAGGWLNLAEYLGLFCASFHRTLYFLRTNENHHLRHQELRHDEEGAGLAR